MGNANVEYERFVQQIIQHLLGAQGLDTVKVEHDVQVKGASRSHQVDVYWEYRLAGVTHRVIINCKNYKNTVEVTDVMTLKGVLMDVPDARGVIVTTMGYQKGAVDYATHFGIGLKIIRPPVDEDWQGRLREIVLQMRFDMPECLGVSFDVDRQWLVDNQLAEIVAAEGPTVVDARTTFIHDQDAGTVEDLNEVWNRVMRERVGSAEFDAEQSSSARWKNAMLERVGRTPIKVDAVTFRWRLLKGVEEREVHVRSEAMAIVRDAIDGTLLFVDPKGIVTGDTEREFGSRG